MALPEVLKHLEVTEATWDRWGNQYGGMNSDGAHRLKELEGRAKHFGGGSAEAGIRTGGPKPSAAILIADEEHHP